MEIAIGFLIALAVGLTGVGGGSFTTPALVLTAGLPAGAAVGTAMVFSAILRFIAAPFYVARGDVHGGYLTRLLLGAIPGLLGGTVLLHFMRGDDWNPVVLATVGAMLILSSALTLVPNFRLSRLNGNGARWVPLLALPIGLETGFSSAGAGALGTILLLNCSEIPASQVVGTDLLFGMILAMFGGAFHLSVGSISSSVLLRLLAGGLPGVLIGSLFARKIPVRRLRATIAIMAMVLGMELLWNGAHGLLGRHSAPIALSGLSCKR
jgi:uncharacterized membrane protein YfcA